MPYQVIEDKNIADINLKIWANTKEALFNEIISAFSNQITQTDKIKKKIKEEIILKEKNFSDLVFGFIEKLIYFKDAKNLIFKEGKIVLSNNQIKGYLFGQKINQDLPIKIDIKAITYHKFRVKKEKNFYCLYLVFDI